jgi:hypothetical protein
MNTIYKVVSIWGNEYTSAIVRLPDWCLTYELGKVIRPKQGFIYAFKEFLDALRFLVSEMEIDYSAILKCEGEIVEYKPYMAPTMMQIGLHNFWTKHWPNNPGLFPHNGTVWCKSLKPIEVAENFTEDTYKRYRYELFGVR